MSQRGDRGGPPSKQVLVLTLRRVAHRLRVLGLSQRLHEHPVRAPRNLLFLKVFRLPDDEARVSGPDRELIIFHPVTYVPVLPSPSQTFSGVSRCDWGPYFFLVPPIITPHPFCPFSSSSLQVPGSSDTRSHGHTVTLRQSGRRRENYGPLDSSSDLIPHCETRRRS